MSNALNRLVSSIPKDKVRIHVTRESDSKWEADLTPDGKTCFSLRLFETFVRVYLLRPVFSEASK